MAVATAAGTCYFKVHHGGVDLLKKDIRQGWAGEAMPSINLKPISALLLIIEPFPALYLFWTEIFPH